MHTPILIITYYWPPSAGAGVQRWLKFAKYLSKAGCKVFILTVAEGTSSAYDPTLEDEVPEELEIHKTRSLEPFRLYNWLRGKKGNVVEDGMSNIREGWFSKFSAWIRANFFIPDARRGWGFHAYPKAKELIQKHQIQHIITTGPPQSTHLIGLRLRRNLPLKWLADLRDPWTKVFYNQFLDRWAPAQWYDQYLENKALRNADEITVISEGMKEEFEDRNQNIHVVYNGYDEQDFDDVDWTYDSDHFSLHYIGNFKMGQNHPPLWQALKELLQENDEFRNAFKMCFTGNVHQSVQQELKKYQIFGNAELRGYQPHSKAIAAMCSADLLLFIISDVEGNEKIISGKIFEYLASRRPIFAIGNPEGAAARVMEECGHPTMLDFHQKEKYKSRIRDHFKKWQEQKQAETIENTRFEKYSRASQADQIKRILLE